MAKTFTVLALAAAGIAAASAEVYFQEKFDGEMSMINMPLHN